MSALTLWFWAILVAIVFRILLKFYQFRKPFAKYYAGKHVWLIGASSGIGEEMLLQLAPTGAILSISSRRADVLEQLKKQAIEKYPAAQVC